MPHRDAACQAPPNYAFKAFPSGEDTACFSSEGVVYCDTGSGTEVLMNLNMVIDDDLIHTAIDLGGMESERDTVNVALQEFVKRRRRMDFLSLAGTIDFDEGWDYRKLRGKA
jgi:Arc/MetJ family transcription regulator